MPDRRYIVSCGLVVLAFGVAFAQSAARSPRIWSDEDLADWATPIAALKVRPAHYSSDEYYRIEGDNYRTYPVYDPASEPAGYWEDLQKKPPEPLVDAGKIRNAQDWIAAGRRAFIEIDSFWTRTSDPVISISVETDPGLALATRKATGFYKIPSLRGVWDRPFLLHDGMADPRRHAAMGSCRSP